MYLLSQTGQCLRLLTIWGSQYEFAAMAFSGEVDVAIPLFVYHSGYAPLPMSCREVSHQSQITVHDRHKLLVVLLGISLMVSRQQIVALQFSEAVTDGTPTQVDAPRLYHAARKEHSL